MTAKIGITEQKDGTYLVVVSEGSTTTEHDVTVPDDYLDELGLAGVDRTELVRRSFEFLLEREPKESIMRRFELSVIQRYFREYPKEIARRLSA